MALSSRASGLVRSSWRSAAAVRPATASARRMAVQSMVGRYATGRPATHGHPPCCVAASPAAARAFSATKDTDAAGAGEVAAPEFSDTTPLDPNAPASFIDRAARFGANALLGAYVHIGRFDRVLEGMKVVRIDSKAGRVLCELPVDKGVQNAYGTLHGGCVATLVDVVGTMALLASNPKKPGVSVDLAVTFCSAAKAGTTVTIEGRVLKAGRRLGFTQVDIRRADGATLASGTHTKAL